jgi:hypothetical protein
MNSKDFEWHEVKNEHFEHNNLNYDVNKAKKIIMESPRPIYWVPIVMLKKAARETRIDRTLDSKVDLKIPIIMVTIDNGEYLCIDGYHRIRKAIKINKKDNSKLNKLLGVVLNKKETKDILI